MTSSDPLAETVLRTLADAAPGSYSKLDVAEQHDFDYLNSLTPGERLGLLNEIMLRAETLGLPPASRELILGRDFRM